MAHTFGSEICTDNYTALPIRFSEEDNGEWLIDYSNGEWRNYLRCDCHDAYWHWGEVHYIPTDAGELIVCDLPFIGWPDHS